MAATGRDAPAPSATAHREIVISRVISAPRELVFSIALSPVLFGSGIRLFVDQAGVHVLQDRCAAAGNRRSSAPARA